MPYANTFARKVWKSPTITGWGNHLAKLLRIFFILPLILTRFDSSEIAAWYLFGSLLLFGQITLTRIGTTCSRMVAFAMSGADTLRPLHEKNKGRVKSKHPNWSLVEKVYSTLCLVTVGSAFLMVVSGAILGYIGLKNIVADNPSSIDIWWAFWITISGQAVVAFLQKYRFMLIGINEVSEVNRSAICFSVIGSLIILGVLIAGAKIWHLAIVTQSIFALENLFLGWRLKKRRDLKIKHHFIGKLDSEVLKWGIGPVVKGFFLQYANSGVIQIGCVAFSAYSDLQSTATFLVTIRILTIIKTIALVPFSSHIPLMSRLLASQDTEHLRKTVLTKFRLTLTTFLVLGFCFVSMGPFALSTIEANVELLPPIEFLLIFSAFFIHNIIGLCLTIPALGNEIVLFWRALLAALISVIIFLIIIPLDPFIGTVLGMFVPQLLVMNIEPLKLASNTIGVTKLEFGRTLLLGKLANLK